jgi:hypothetical protein
VQAFEQKYSLALPAEYRGFLICVGNGGAGPAYGLFKRGEMDNGCDHASWAEDNGFIGVLSKPFPLTKAWYDQSGKPEWNEDSEAFNETEFEAAFSRWDEQYFSSERVCGAIPICNLGCALRQCLVITGPEVGHIWCDDRPSDGGLYPLAQNGFIRVTFLQWYDYWLHEALAAL